MDVPGQLNILTGELDERAEKGIRDKQQQKRILADEQAQATVCQLSCQTQETLDLPYLPSLTTDQLADVVIEGVWKFERYLPYVIALKKKFGDAPRDENNRLKTPIKDCHTWSEFCTKCLDRTRQAIDKAIREPEVSNRELQRRQFISEHPEYANEPNKVVSKAIFHAMAALKTADLEIVVRVEPIEEKHLEMVLQTDRMQNDFQRQERTLLQTERAEPIEKHLEIVVHAIADLRDWRANECPHIDAHVEPWMVEHNSYELVLVSLTAEEVKAACMAVEELRRDSQ